MDRRAALALLAAGVLLTGCDLGRGATIQDAAPRYQALSDAYQGAIMSAALLIQNTHPGAATIAGAMASMERATRQFAGNLRQIQFPDGMRAQVAAIETDSASLAEADLRLVNEAANLPRADVATWNRLDSQWRADDKQLRTDLGLPVPDFDNH